MQLVELVRGIATSDETFDISKAYVERLEKTIAVSEDFPGFMVNRILLPMINEAIYTLYEGVGNVDSIDTAMKLGANHPMGPLQLADFIGLDTCLSIMQVLHDGLADSANTAPARFWSNMLRPDGSARNQVAAFTTIAAKSPCRRVNVRQSLITRPSAWQQCDQGSNRVWMVWPLQVSDFAAGQS